MTISAFSRYRAEWYSGPTAARRDILAGMVGTFALIPEVIAFSFVAGIDPEVGLFASFVIGIVIAFAGGRRARSCARASISPRRDDPRGHAADRVRARQA
jgi:SulP family sulfate permease